MALSVIKTNSIAANAITAAKIDTDTITAGDIAPNAVDSSEIATGAIDLAHMSVNSIDSDQYVDGSIDLVHMSANSIDSDQYVDGSIDNAHLAANSVDSDQYVDSSIDTAHIAASQITNALMADDAVGIAELSATGTASSSTFLRGDNAWVASGLAWQAVVTGATTMVAGRGYFVNTTGSAFSMTLPGSATIGDEVHIIDYAGTFDTNNCTVARNSHKILGATSDLVVATERAAFKLVYVDATQGWLLTEL